MKECVKFDENEAKNLNDERALPSSLSSTILDSSLISRTKPNTDYDIKCITCGKYKQYYKTNYINSHKIDNWEKFDTKDCNYQKINNIMNLDIDNLYNINNNLEILTNIEQQESEYNKFCRIREENNVFRLTMTNENIKDLDIKQQEIEYKNLTRAKNNLCRLIMTNEDIFKTFITLTFNENINNLDKANYEFNKFCRKVRRVFPNFSYIGVIEFQKNERIHYHLITNIDYNNNVLINENIALNKYISKHNENLDLSQFYVENIILKENEKMNDKKIVLRLQDNCYENTKCTYNLKSHKYKVFKTIKYWNNGFSSILKINSVCGNISNVARYMAKYMTKDFDNRLFGRKKYLYSYNLKKPVITYLSSNSEIDNFILENDLKSENIKFQKEYKDKFNNIYQFYEIVTNDKIEYHIT